MVVRLGVDGGNTVIKVFGEKGEYKISARLGEFRAMSAEKKLGENDIIFEYKRRKGFAGTLAESESEFDYSLGTESKAHEDIAIRVLLGICKYTDESDFEIVVGQPISSHTATEKALIKGFLLGEHDFVINNVLRHINIQKVEVSAEGAAAYWAHPEEGVIHILDIGSNQVNAATFIDGNYQDKTSFSITEFGTETNITNDVEAMTKAIYSRCYRRKWRPAEKVKIVGGRASAFVTPFAQYFDNVSALSPKLPTSSNSKIRLLSPIYANAVGFYNIAEAVYGEEEQTDPC